MSAEPIPAIAEAAAEGEVALVFADIRASLGIPVVNLVWRHLATLPGALGWAWETAKPLYVSGAAEAAAAKFRTRMALPALPVVPPEALGAAGLSSADIATICAVLDTYNRGNALNQMALTALIVEPGVASGQGDGQVGGPTTIEIPALPALDALPAEVLALVHRLNRFGARPDEPIIASLYRHLAHWPSFLAIAWALLAPLQADGRLDQTIAKVRLDAREAARPLAARIVGSGTSAAAALARAAIPAFADHAIARMVPIGQMLRHAIN